MKSIATSLPLLETALFKLNFKKKKFIYEIARLEYRTWLALTKLSHVEELIKQEGEYLASLQAALKVVGEGKLAAQLNVYIIKTEYKLFKLQIRKNKIDIAKLLCNQSKLGQLKQALLVLETDIEDVEEKISLLKPVSPTDIEVVADLAGKERPDERPVEVENIKFDEHNVLLINYFLKAAS